MKKEIVRSLRVLLTLTIVTGFLYPILIAVIARVVFPKRAEGSLLERDGVTVGSLFVAQKFESDRYFWPRPSAVDYNPLPSGATNFGPTSDTLRRVVEFRRAAFISRNQLGLTVTVPNDMLFSSGSGLDPEISPESAFLQVDRVARARHFDERQKSALRELVVRSVRSPQFRILGMARVNVLSLNLAIDALK
ncbi:MAG TPA: potassium-transporting ATPase subunit KdpC [Bacteroidota bacterium]|nr:potassium-transporting ATPase subunit KdpC [Bacteroidota bacterium]